MSKLPQFVHNLFFQQILTTHFICIILCTRSRWIKRQQMLSLGNLQLNREYQNVHLIITQNRKYGSVSDKVYRSWEEREAMWRWMRIDFVYIVGIQVDSWRRGNVWASICEPYTCYYSHCIRMKSIQKEEGNFLAAHRSDYWRNHPTASLCWSWSCGLRATEGRIQFVLSDNHLVNGIYMPGPQPWYLGQYLFHLQGTKHYFELAWGKKWEFTEATEVWRTI